MDFVQHKNLRGLAEETISYEFITEFYGTTEGIKDSSSSFTEEVFTDILHHAVREETTSQNLDW